MLNNLLVYRLVIVNLIGLLFVGYAATQGWVSRVMLSDHTGIVWLCVLFFLIFMGSLAIRATKVSACLNAIKAGGKVDVNATKFIEKAAHLDDMVGWIMYIGLIGNALGIMLSIAGANLGAAEGGKDGIIELLGSLDVAFGATIVSGALGVWADINRRILKTATVLMLEDAK